jgi:hypothetical protein
VFIIVFQRDCIFITLIHILEIKYICLKVVIPFQPESLQTDPLVCNFEHY